MNAPATYTTMARNFEGGFSGFVVVNPDGSMWKAADGGSPVYPTRDDAQVKADQLNKAARL